MPPFERTFRRGARGPAVEQLQRRLQALGLYLGRVDGDFGGGTEGSVKRFQADRGLTADGEVGPRTWAALFPGTPAPPPADVAGRPLLARCLELTGVFETNALAPGCYGCVAGDFDGQGISYGALQWNMGQGSLPPLFARLDAAHPGVLDEVFQDQASEWRGVMARPKAGQLAWVRAAQTPRGQLTEPWLGLLKSLGHRPEFQQVQGEAAREVFGRALDLARAFGLRTERAAALCFDVVTQNGSVSAPVRQLIRQDFAGRQVDADPLAEEVARLRIVANRRADAAKARWREDVRRRKLTIAEGRGTVHGRHYDVEAQYGIRLAPAAELA